MMKSYVRYTLAFTLLAAAPVAAQQSGRGDTTRAPRWERGQGREARPAMERLVALRQELQLTDAQVARLQEIGRRLEERNAPFRAQLETQREQYKAERRAQMEKLTPEQRRDTLRMLRERRGRKEVPQAMRAPMERMRENLQAAMQEAQAVLTPQQKERARQLMAEARQARGDRMGAEGRHRRGGQRRDGAGAPRP
jgi:iron-sulfur cluster repair protein YtfE (RIC family)